MSDGADEDLTDFGNIFTERSFDEASWTFVQIYPIELREVLTLEEWKAIMRRLNEDLNAELLAVDADLKAWHKATIYSSIFVVGMLLWPVVMYKIYQRNLVCRKYWRSVRKYLAHLSKTQKDSPKHLTWQLDEDTAKYYNKNTELTVHSWCRKIIIKWTGQPLNPSTTPAHRT